MRAFVVLAMLLIPAASAHHAESWPETDVHGDHHHWAATPGDLFVHRNPDVEAAFKQWEADHPDLVDTYTIGQSGTLMLPLWTIRITDESVPFDGADTATGQKVRVYIDGGHHGNEFMGTDLPMYYMAQLLDNADSEEWTAWLATHELWATPIVNPEGNALDTRKSGSQVDLNRNYPFDFGGAATSDLIVSLNYKGEAPLDQAETAANAAFAKDLMPDVWITGHSGTAELLYPWGWVTERSPDDDFFRSMEEPFEAATNGEIDMKMSAELYPAGGATDDWGYGQLGIPTHTYEVHGDQFIPVYPETVPVAIANQLNGLDFIVQNAMHWGAWISMHDRDGELHVYNEGFARAKNITLLHGDQNITIPQLEPGEMWTTPLLEGAATVLYKQMLVDAPDAKTRVVEYMAWDASLAETDDAEASALPLLGLVAALAIALLRRR